MEHIDEGTIHAWLDGALPASEGERVEQHVAACATCAAAVAEARGLIAASSRILSALDDVPAGVAPRRVAHDPALPPSGEPASGTAPAVGTRANTGVADRVADGAGGAAPARRRPWWQRPQFAAAAGIAFVAVALSVVWQRTPGRSVADYAAEVASEPTGAAPASAMQGASDSLAAPVPPTPQAMPLPDPSAPAPLTAGGRGVAREEVSSAAAKAAPAAPAEGVAPAARAPSPARGAVASAERPGAGDERAKALADIAPEPQLTAARARNAAESKRAVPAAPPAPAVSAAPAPPTAPGAQPARPDSTATTRRLTLDADAVTRSEKARVAGEREAQLQAVVTTGATAAVDARRDLTTVEGIVGCYRLQRRVPALEAGIPEVVALDAAEHGTFEGNVLREARLIGAPPDAGTAWRWTLSPRGDVALVRVQGGAHARFPLALRLAAQTGETSAATRIACPSR